MVRPVPACAVEQRRVELAQFGIRRNRAVHKRIDRTADARIAVIHITRAVALADVVDLLDARAEDIIILESRALNDFDVRAVHRPERDRAVQHQLHVARAGCLRASRRNLLRDIRRRNDVLCVRAVVVLHEHNLHLIRNRRVVVHKLCHTVNIPDNGLRAHIAGRGLRTENERGRRKVLN